MQHFYDGQIRRYLLQIVRLLSNFTVKYGDGTLARVPVVYGDSDRQVANIIAQNSENSIQSTPKIAVYITGLGLDRDRLSDSTYVGKIHIRERDINETTNEYTSSQGKNYTVERLMPTPYKLTVKTDIWTSSTEQKLQVLEQILMLFNPSLEIQTTDNYIDWTSLSVVNLTDVTFSSRTIPVGTGNQIDIATMTFDTPIWISPPVKVKQMGVITNIIMGLYSDVAGNLAGTEYVEGLGTVPLEPYGSYSEVLGASKHSIGNFGILAWNGEVRILDTAESITATNIELAEPLKQGVSFNWRIILDQYLGKYIEGASTLILIQSDTTEVRGTIAINPLDETILTVNWDPDTYPTNTGIDSEGRFDTNPTYDALASNRPSSTGTFDAIIDPTTKGPGSGLAAPTVGTRYLIIENIGDVGNTDGADAWKGTDNSELIAGENDIIEWNGTRWIIIFDASESGDFLIYQTNIFPVGPGVQYKWNGVSWVKAFDGEYRRGEWRLEL